MATRLQLDAGQEVRAPRLAERGPFPGVDMDALRAAVAEGAVSWRSVEIAAGVAQTRDGRAADPWAGARTMLSTLGVRDASEAQLSQVRALAERLWRQDATEPVPRPGFETVQPLTPSPHVPLPSARLYGGQGAGELGLEDRLHGWINDRIPTWGEMNAWASPDEGVRREAIADALRRLELPVEDQTIDQFAQTFRRILLEGGSDQLEGYEERHGPAARPTAAPAPLRPARTDAETELLQRMKEALLDPDNDLPAGAKEEVRAGLWD